MYILILTNNFKVKYKYDGYSKNNKKINNLYIYIYIKI